MFDAYYVGYRGRFGRYIRHHYSDQSAEIAALIRSRQTPRLLEIGGGCGTEALWFALQGARVLAIDVNEERLAVARARKEVIERGIGRPLDIEFRFCSLFDLDAPAAFDLIWMEQAFHHVEPRDKIYSTIARLLAPEGHVVISEANGWNPLLQLVLFRKRGFQTIVDRTTADGQHILYGNERITIPSAMARGFEEAGIQQEAVRYFRALPNIAAAEVLDAGGTRDSPVRRAVFQPLQLRWPQAGAGEGAPMNERPWLILPIETKARELDAKTYTACAAAEAGFNVMLGEQNGLLRRLARLPRGFYLDKSIAPLKVAPFERLKKLGFRVMAWCEEGLVYRDRDAYLHERVASEGLRRSRRLLRLGRATGGGCSKRGERHAAPHLRNRQPALRPVAAWPA